MVAIDKRIENTSLLIGHVKFCQLRLVQDQRYFWLLIIPEKEGLVEWHDLNDSEVVFVSKLIHHCSAELKRATNAVKINIGAIGNIVPMLHIHIVARQTGDPAWPEPVWGRGQATKMSLTEEAWRAAVVKDIIKRFSNE
ncbi:HIT family protein [Alphaproteobacteria bacterium LSUCC0684]